MIERTDVAAYKAGNRVVELEAGETVGVVSNIEVLKESLPVDAHEQALQEVAASDASAVANSGKVEVPVDPVVEEGA